MSGFTEFGLDPLIIAAVDGLGFETATPVQVATIPPLLAGRDVIGQARTGSGKTAAFGLPMLERVKEGGKAVRGLVLTPTRELALQVTEALRSFAKGLPVRMVTIYGGAPYPPQLKALRNGSSIVVGTPGRVIDHLDRGTLDLSQVEMFVLDEADEMLRMGFLEDVQRVLEALPENRQIALFSATMPAPIRKVSQRFLNDPELLAVESSELTVDHIEQFWIRTPERAKLDVLMRILQSDPGGASLIFTRTRRGCAQLADGLAKKGIAADAIHGDLNQAARERVLNRLRSKSLSVLVATDVAARGIDVNHLSRVVNYDFPTGAEIYVHRIGRTARAGMKGTAIMLVTPGQQRRLGSLTRAIKHPIHEMQPPSNAELGELQRSAVWSELRTAAEDEALIETSAWLGEMCAKEDVPMEKIAAAAVQLLCDKRGIVLFPPEEIEAPMGPRGRKSRAELQRVNEVQLYLNIGKFAGVRPADIVGALTNEVGISGGDVGRISLFDRKAFVGLPGAIAQRVLTEYPELTIRGNAVHVALARPRPTDPYPKRRGKKPPHRKTGGAPPWKNKGKKKA